MNLDLLPRGRLRGQSLTRLLPNLMTLLALAAGLTAIRFGGDGRWEAATTAIVIAAVLDASDGRLARLLNAQTRFGAELDSLADVVSFGVAPAMLLYMWTMRDAGPIGWVVCLLFVVCVALRLARFNTTLEEDGDRPVWARQFFTGVASPAGAGFVLIPMMLSFQGPGFASFFSHPLLVGVMMVVVSFLLISRVPTFAMKRVRVPQRGILPLMLGVTGVAAFLVGAPWSTLAVVGIVYLATIPFSLASYRRLSRTQTPAPAPPPPPAADAT